MKRSVAVIGAGVNGLIAARELAKNGIEVKVYDQEKMPGQHAKASGILSIAGLEALGIGYKPAITNKLYGAIIHAGKEKIEIIAKEPKAYVLNRPKLNEICMKEAESKGAVLELGKRVDTETLMKLHSNKIIVGADGAPSSVASHFHFPPIEDHVLTYRAEYDYPLENPHIVELYFDKDITPGFFAWIAAESKDVTEIAIGIDSKHGSSKAAFERFLKLKGVDKITTNAKELSAAASIIPVAVRERFVNEEEEVLLVGDAAGQTKPSTGGGIIFGGAAAIYAANALALHIKEGLPLAFYEKRWKKEFMKEVVLHKLLRKIYSSKSFPTMLHIMKLFGIEQTLGTYGDMDRPTKIIKNFLLRKKQSN